MNALETALYSALTGGTALTALLAGTTSVYNTIAPPDATYDFVVFNQQSGAEDNQDPRDRTDFLYQVKAISATSMAAAGSIALQIDAILDGSALSVTGYKNVMQRRWSRVRYTDVTPEGNRYYHAGAIYRIHVEESA